MCGYCIEGAYFLRFIDVEINIRDPFIYSVYMEENENFIEELNTIKEGCNIVSILDFAETCIIYCRILEKLILENKNFYYILQDNHYIEFVNNIINANRYEYRFLNNFIIKRLCSDKEYCKEFLQNKTKLIDVSTKILKDYYNFWLFGQEKETSDPNKRLSEKGIMDPVENTHQRIGKNFIHHFLLYF